ncbi:unnamed protein product [Paramecium octaurelia]|uniref:Uncharacterized protein n=1 Tax=Paramecium octaurelia TaxID=43137 RepID=A0A8S1TYP1_PAROT|nr:unnamed protein product [Paramecium octaurelia]
MIWVEYFQISSSASKLNLLPTVQEDKHVSPLYGQEIQIKLGHQERTGRLS